VFEALAGSQLYGGRLRAKQESREIQPLCGKSIEQGTKQMN
jgi:hypothetical protein